MRVRVPGGGKASPVTPRLEPDRTEAWAMRQGGHCEQRAASGGPEAGRNTVSSALSKEVDDSKEGAREGMQVGGEAGCTRQGDTRRGHSGSRIKGLGTD